MEQDLVLGEIPAHVSLDIYIETRPAALSVDVLAVALVALAGARSSSAFKPEKYSEGQGRSLGRHVGTKQEVST